MHGHDGDAQARKHGQAGGRVCGYVHDGKHDDVGWHAYGPACAKKDGCDSVCAGKTGGEHHGT